MSNWRQRMRVFPMAMVLAVLAGPVYAQGVNLMAGERRLTSEEIEKNKAIDEAYKSTIKKIPDQKPNADPWGNVRGSNATQPTPSKTTSQKTSKAHSSSR